MHTTHTARTRAAHWRRTLNAMDNCNYDHGTRAYQLAKRAHLAAERVSARNCPHAPTRQRWWHALDGTLCGACCDCGAILRGAVS